MTEPADPMTVPRPRPSFLSRAYLGVGVAALVLYGLAGFLGWDFQTTERNAVPASARSSPGGYRSFGFWHGGYHGGK